jgi:ornithine carbamoyltransferase
VSDVHLAFVGDGNNVAHSLMLTAALLGGVFTIATPPGYEPDGEIVTIAKATAVATGACINVTHDPIVAVSKADAIYTDVWASMGQESEAAQRRSIFAPYQVNDELMSFAANHAVFMHCLPAHRGDEVVDSVIDSSRSVVFDQAGNRLHVQKAILYLLLSDSRHHLISGRANA